MSVGQGFAIEKAKGMGGGLAVFNDELGMMNEE
jgi:hypothetical protein